ncbi:hypothetical protein RFI_37728 [Reticulomyxa filosa]|uniref:Uncharacterized protein n=1 Tax=Reticulomyxa filosa TaxID=46433 RepID=X6LG86_RETFI|nr:hypothetical protein RFI_37728 [Reticulomyxa filosa]|eukprot:ETN99739.1 hypothetical protein RFI_37728 [Reticulomyxa filosa]
MLLPARVLKGACRSPSDWFFNHVVPSSPLNVCDDTVLPLSCPGESMCDTQHSTTPVVNTNACDTKHHLLASLKEPPHWNHRQKTKAMATTICSAVDKGEKKKGKTIIQHIKNSEIADVANINTVAADVPDLADERMTETTIETGPPALQPLPSFKKTKNPQKSKEADHVQTGLKRKQKKRSRKEMEGDPTFLSDSDKIMIWGGKEITRIALDVPKLVRHKKFPFFVCLQTHLDIRLDGSTNNNNGFFRCCYVDRLFIKRVIGHDIAKKCMGMMLSIQHVKKKKKKKKFFF